MRKKKTINNQRNTKISHVVFDFQGNLRALNEGVRETLWEDVAKDFPTDQKGGGLLLDPIKTSQGYTNTSQWDCDDHSARRAPPCRKTKLISNNKLDPCLLSYHARLGFLVGQLEFGKVHGLLHPVGSKVGRLVVKVHGVQRRPFRFAARDPSALNVPTPDAQTS